MATNYDFIFKIFVVGDSGVGKTQIINRYVEGTFDPLYTPSNISGVKTKTVSLYEKIIQLQIRDVIGDEVVLNLFSKKGVNAYMLVCDWSSCDTLEYWLKAIKKYGPDDAEVVLVANKRDFYQQNVSDAAKFAEFHKIRYIEASAQSNSNIRKAFELLVKIILENKYEIHHIEKTNEVENKSIENPKEKTKKERLLRESLNKAKKEHGTIPVRFLKLFFTGSGAAGKTSFINLLLKKQFNKDHHSTNAAHINHAVSVKKFIFHECATEFMWVEFNPKLEISHLSSVLLSKPTTIPSDPLSATETEVSEENIMRTSNLLTRIRSSLKRWFPRISTSSVNDINLSTFPSIIDATETIPIVHQPGEILNIITLLDTGGQPEYIHLLPTINIYPTVTFVIHDLSKSLNDQVLVKYSQHGKPVFTPYHLNYSNLDMIKLLMSAANDSVERPIPNIPKLATTPGSNKKSYICLVGTHADIASLQTVAQVERELDTLVNKTDCEAAVWQNDTGGVLFSVDNTTAGSEYIEDPIADVIRSKIDKLAEKTDIYELPITWILLELEIRQTCSKMKKPYILFQNCVALAEQTGLISDKEQVKSVLLYHHLLGVLIYFDNIPDLQDYVIVDHQWWFDKLSSIIQIAFKQASDDRKAEQKLVYQGLLSKELLQHAGWKDDIKEELFLSLLVHMRIIAPTKKEEYFIPFILPSCNLQNSDLLNQYGHLQGEPLLVHFQSGFLPRGMFCSLIVELLQHSPKSWHPHFSHERVHHTFSNLISFRLHEDYSLSLLDKVSYLEVQIRRVRKDLHTPVHNNVYNYLVYALTEVCVHLNFDYERLQYGFVCDCGKNIDNHIAIVPDISPSLRYAECSINSLHLLPLDFSHLIWFFLKQPSSLNNEPAGTDTTMQEASATSSNTVATPTRATTTKNQAEILNKRPEMFDLQKIVISRIMTEWEYVAEALRYDIPTIKAIKEKERGDPKKCCREFFMDWLETNNGAKAGPKVWSTLLDVLKEVDAISADITEAIIAEVKQLK